MLIEITSLGPKHKEITLEENPKSPIFLDALVMAVKFKLTQATKQPSGWPLKHMPIKSKPARLKKSKKFNLKLWIILTLRAFRIPLKTENYKFTSPLNYF
jgi:hypothetical protein